MDENFTNNAEGIYLASLTQAKKILYLQRELSNSEHYTKNLQQDLAATKLTLNRLIKQRTNNEILAKMSENLYRMERKYKEAQEFLKQNNAKLLIQMQLRLQEKAEYSEKIRELQQQIQSIRKTNKDKQQQFTIIVNKLRKYEQIRQLTLQQKLLPTKDPKQKQSKQMRNNLLLKQVDKDMMIKELNQELNYFKSYCREVRVQVDRKVAVLGFALETQRNYWKLREEFLGVVANGDKKAGQTQKLMIEKFGKNTKQSQPTNSSQPIPNPPSSSPNLSPNPTTSPSPPNPLTNLPLSTKQLLKQLKKLLISNKLLQSALNQSTEKNQELLIQNQVLMESCNQLREELEEYGRKQGVLGNWGKKGGKGNRKGDGSRDSQGVERFGSILKIPTNTSKNRTQNLPQKPPSFTNPSIPTQSLSQKNSTQPFPYPYPYPSPYPQPSPQPSDDLHLILPSHSSTHLDIPQIIKQKKLKQYLKNLKSSDYDVNVEMLYRDVHRMGEFLVLALGARSKDGGRDDGREKGRLTYTEILQEELKNKNRMIHRRSISSDIHHSQKQLPLNPTPQTSSLLRQQILNDSEKYLQRQKGNQKFKKQLQTSSPIPPTKNNNNNNKNDVGNQSQEKKNGQASIQARLQEEFQEIYIQEF